ncbi:MAG: DoxX family protein [Pseudomonadota bacterium]
MINSQTTPYAALVLRLSLGVMFIAHALLKVLVFTPAGTAGYFESIGIPGAFAYVTIFAELLGGISLIVGFATRWVSIALIPVLAGTIVFVHGGSGWLFSNEGGGWEYPLFLIMASASLALIGDGAYSFNPFNRKQKS